MGKKVHRIEKEDVHNEAATEAAVTRTVSDRDLINFPEKRRKQKRFEN